MAYPLVAPALPHFCCRSFRYRRYFHRCTYWEFGVAAPQRTCLTSFLRGVVAEICTGSRAEPDYGERRSQRTLAALAHQAGIASPTHTLNHCSALQALALVTSAVYLTVTNIATVQRERVRANSAFNVLTAGSPGFTTFAFLVLTFPGKAYAG